jgi:hypothetical protein
VPRGRLVAGILVAVLELWAPTSGQVGPPGRLQRLGSGTGLILGRVVDADTSRGVADAMVILSGSSLGTSANVFTDGTQGGNRSIVTDSDGRFLFRGLPPGSYRAIVLAAGYFDGVFGRTRPVQVARSLDLTRTIDLVAGERRSDVVIPIWKLAIITGRVVDEAGEPFVGLNVWILTRLTIGGGPVMQQFVTAQTDDRGQYLASVPPGSYIAGVLAAPTTMPAETLDEYVRTRVEGASAVTPLTTALTAGGTSPASIRAGTRIGDRIVATTHSPSLTSSAGSPLPAPSIGSTGRMTIYPTTFHPSSLTASAATVVNVAAGEEKSGVDIQLTPRPTVEVSGRLIDPSGRPAAHVAVRLSVDDPAVTRTSPATVIDETVGVSDASGAFTLLGVVPGQYKLRVLIGAPPSGRGGSAPSVPTSWAVEPVAVGETDIHDLNVVLNPASDVRGRLVFDGGAPDLARRPSVTATAVPGSTASMVSNGRPVTVAPDGTFVLPKLVPGPYVLSIVSLPAGWTARAAIVDGQDALDVPVQLPPGGGASIDIAIVNRVTTVSGVAREPDGRPAQLATVGVFPADPSLWRRVGMSSRRTLTAAPSRTGAYTLTDVPPGDYFVAAVDGDVDFSNHDHLKILSRTATRLTIGDGESRRVDLQATVIR